jgi:hypothetical protein
MRTPYHAGKYARRSAFRAQPSALGTGEILSTPAEIDAYFDRVRKARRSAPWSADGYATGSAAAPQPARWVGDDGPELISTAARAASKTAASAQAAADACARLGGGDAA